MPVERKPLFRAEITAPRAAALALDEATLAQAKEILGRWAQLLDSPEAAALKETQLLPDFLTDVFYRVLGYRGPGGGGERHTLRREQKVELDKVADAVLGEFEPGSARALVAVEGKGPRDPLDRPFAGRGMSAVDQAYRYAINLPCDWILLTNLREIRLYHKSHDQRTFERFEIATLAREAKALRLFVFLLGAGRVVPEQGLGHLDELLKTSERAGLELTRSYYAEYARVRRETLAHLRQANSRVLPEILLLHTQKLLDRVLFVAFAEDRALLPSDTLRRAFEHRDPYNPRSLWETFRGLFEAVDQGRSALGIPGYNGGLFARDPGLELLAMPDEVFAGLKRLGDYDYRQPAPATSEEPQGARLVDVEILGHIFEQSMTELETLSRELAEGQFSVEGLSRRRREGAFYTPRVITRFIVGHALSRVLEERFEELRRLHEGQAIHTAIKVLENPRTYDPLALNNPQREALIRFWDTWLGEVEQVRILDPACGSGAFLTEAFDQLHAVYQEVGDRLYELRGSRLLFDPDRTILERNLYGVDINDEAIEICKLSIWIKTAQYGKKLTDLDRTIRVGNSLVDDREVDPRAAFDWRARFPEVFASGGFDVVIGNPPYVRQELLAPLKPYFARRFRSYHGAADLYVYFFERGLDLLRPGGRLSFIVNNKWLRAGYAEPLRRLLTEESWPEVLVDLGHAKKVFPDADVLPSILVSTKPRAGAQQPLARAAVISRDEVRLDDLGLQVEEQGFPIPLARLGAGPWELEPPAVEGLLAKLRARGVPLTEYAGTKPYYGIKTGLNEAFLVDTATRDRLVAEDPRAADVLKPYLRGQDVGRWRPEWAGLWMILLKSSDDQTWLWSSSAGLAAEEIFASAFSSLYRYLLPWKEKLIARSDQGRFWWELRRCAYYAVFERPKILWQLIQYHPAYALDHSGNLTNDKLFCLPIADNYLCAVLNSPLLWWHNWRSLVHLKDEALNPAGYMMEQVPIAVPEIGLRQQIEERVVRLLEIEDNRGEARSTLADWLLVEHAVTASGRLADPFLLSSDELVAEVKRARGRRNPLSAAGLRNLREEHARSIAPMAEQLQEAARLEREISDRVCQAYGLTEDEIELLWRTAPPRMPTAS